MSGSKTLILVLAATLLFLLYAAIKIQRIHQEIVAQLPEFSIRKNAKAKAQLDGEGR
jgi:hypothetical protein